MNLIETEIFGHLVTIGFDENSIHIFNSYHVKDKLKSRGYKFDPERKSWFLKTENLDRELEQLKKGERSNKTEAAFGVPVSRKSGEAVGFPHSYSVSELRNRIDSIVKNEFGGKIWIRGVVASEVKRYNWFSYFNLKDEERNDLFFNVECRNSSMDEVQSRLSRLKIADRLEKDLPVMIGAEVKISQKNLIDVRLNMTDIIPEFTVAKLRNQREITIERLKEEDLLVKQKELKLPLLVVNIGIISSGQGTSVKDILAGLSPFGKVYSYCFIDSRMEGNQAVESVMRAIELFESDKTPDLDALVIARGGGSEQSLSVFNDYDLCRKICLCRIPVITAIGHEKDLSAVEICSYLTPVPSTPSGIGKYLAERFLQMREDLFSNFNTISEILKGMNERERTKISSTSKHVRILILKFLSSMEFRLKNVTGELQLRAEFFLKGNRLKLERKFLGLTVASTEVIRRKSYYSSEIAGNILNGLKISFIKKISVFLGLTGRLDLTRGSLMITEKRRSVNIVIKNFLPKLLSTIDSEEKKLEIINRLIIANDPLEVLKKGFTIVVNENNTVIKRLEEFKNSRDKKLKFYDGEIFIEERRKNG